MKIKRNPNFNFQFNDYYFFRQNPKMWTSCSAYSPIKNNKLVNQFFRTLISYSFGFWKASEYVYYSSGLLDSILSTTVFAKSLPCLCFIIVNWTFFILYFFAPDYWNVFGFVSITFNFGSNGNQFTQFIKISKRILFFSIFPHLFLEKEPKNEKNIKKITKKRQILTNLLWFLTEISL